MAHLERRQKMKKIAIVSSAFGVVCAIILHFVALSGRALGGGTPLALLFPLLFACFGSAILRVVLRGREEKKARVDFTGLVTPWLQWPCIALIAYGFLFGFGGGKVTHQFGEVLSPQKAAAFYGAMISFFAMALLVHVGLSAKNKPKPAEPTHGM